MRVAQPVGLYIHVPFCQTKCGYCDFYSVAIHERRPPDALLDGLARELEIRTRDRAQPFATIFAGGGTPTILVPEQLSRLFAPLGRIARQDEVVEFTVEANPATLDADKLSVLLRSGVDRVSMGAQSFHPAELETLERLHSPDDIPKGVELLRRHGVRRINLDLIFGIPGQTLASWKESLERAIRLDIDHIACYGLTYEPGTRLTKQLRQGRIQPCDDELAAEMYECAIDRLARDGYDQYEISNFARPNQQCRHNLIYWRNHDYVGVGPSAAGFVGGERYKNVADVARYIQLIERDGAAVVESERLMGLAAAADTLMTQLRLNEGIEVAEFIARHGPDAWGRIAPVCQRLKAMGVVENGARLSLTRKGRLVADAALVELLAALDDSVPITPALSLPVLSR